MPHRHAHHYVLVVTALIVAGFWSSFAAAPASAAHPSAAPLNGVDANQTRPVVVDATKAVSQPIKPSMTVQLILPAESPKPTSFLESLKGLKENTLVQNIILLLMTAVITGLAIPKIKSRMDLRYFREQKEHEADLARQTSLIADQTKFLHAYAELLWRLHFAMIRISYAKATQLGDEEFSALWAKYQIEAWDAMQGQRRLISSSINLVSPAFFDSLLAFYRTALQDEAVLSEKIRSGHDDWNRYHRDLMHDAVRLDQQVIALADELGLAPNHVSAPETGSQHQNSSKPGGAA